MTAVSMSIDRDRGEEEQEYINSIDCLLLLFFLFFTSKWRTNENVREWEIIRLDRLLATSFFSLFFLIEINSHNNIVSLDLSKFFFLCISFIIE